MMSKLLFEVELDGDWLVAVCHEPEMATQAKSLEELPTMIRDLVNCRFDPGDMGRDEAKFESPAWHEDVLRQRQAGVRTGKEQPLDWEAAKAQLRKLRP